MGVRSSNVGAETMEMRRWRFLDTGKENAFFNMALDEALVRAVHDHTTPPSIRVYEWHPRAITCGYSQDVGSMIDLARCTAEGVDVTRRLTGGRAVFHDDELGYSVVGLVDDPRFGGSIRDTFQSIGRVLVSGLNALDIPAELSRGERTGGSSGRSLPCFLTTARYEITVDGHKIVGSAQCRFAGVFLQQGSILTGPGQDRLLKYLINPGLPVRDRGKHVGRRFYTLSGMTGNTARATLKETLFTSFDAAVGGHCERVSPTQAELDDTERFIRERYASKGWILGHEQKPRV